MACRAMHATAILAYCIDSAYKDNNVIVGHPSGHAVWLHASPDCMSLYLPFLQARVLVYAAVICGKSSCLSLKKVKR